MKYTYKYLILIFIFLTGCASTQDYSLGKISRIGGDPKEVFRATEITREVELATQAAISAIKSNNSVLSEIIGAEYQFDRGVNYSVTFVLEDESIWEALVFQDFSGNNFVEYVGPFEE